MKEKENNMRVYFRGDDGIQYGPLIVRSFLMYTIRPMPVSVADFEVGRLYRQFGLPEQAELSFEEFIRTGPDNHLKVKAYQYLEDLTPNTVVETTEEDPYRIEVKNSIGGSCDGDSVSIHVFGPSQLPGDLRILYSKGFRRVTPSEYHKLMYTNQVDIDEKLVEALHLQKQAHVLLRNTNNDFIRYLLEIRQNHKSEAIDAFFDWNDQGYEIWKKEVTKNKRYTTAVCGVIEELVDKELDRINYIKTTIGNDEIFESIEPVLIEILSAFDKQFFSGMDYVEAYKTHDRRLKSALNHYPKKYQEMKKRIMSVAAVSSSVFSDLRQAKQNQESIEDIVDEFGGHTELNFKDSNLWIYLPNQNGVKFRKPNL